MKPSSPEHITSLPSLLSFWAFQEPAGADRAPIRPHRYSLGDGGAPCDSAHDKTRVTLVYCRQ
jgi:hypothetical protein